MEKIHLIKIGFNFSQMGFFTDVIKLERSSDYNLTDYCQHIGCSMIDIAYLSRDVCIIVDDEGLLKSGNPVFEVKTANGHSLQLAGTLLVAGNKETDDGAEIDTLSTYQCLELLHNLQICLIGETY